ncbi:MAG: 30S ribosomal protein S19 [Candidatus Pacearchaeota archaeon]|nr:30S ribosomal protein S19 [Candidatus Pacearchaeota archaeon]
MVTTELEKKKEYYRGKTLEELQQLDIREFAKYLTSRERRSVLRNFDVVEKFVKSSREKQSRNKPIKTHLRDLVIVPGLVGMVVQVYNGRVFLQVRITTEMLGHRLGEFALTRKKVQHGAPGIGATKSSASASVK